MIGQGIRRLSDRFTPFLRDLAHLAVGSDGQVLTLSGGKPTWGDAAQVPYVSTPQTLTLGGLISLSHGLGSRGRVTAIEVVCQTAEQGYSVGDIVPIEIGMDSVGNAQGHGMQPYWSVSDADTKIYIRVGNTAIGIVGNKSTGAAASLTNPANWKAIFTVEPA